MMERLSGELLAKSHRIIERNVGSRKVCKLDSDFWAITAIYNFGASTTRVENFRIFRRSLCVPLLAVEFSPSGKYLLSANDADVLVQLSDGDLMWQKERLLNIAVQRLPQHCNYVAALDADIVFLRTDWPDETVRVLDQHSLMQPFSSVRYLNPESDPRSDCADGFDWESPSFGYGHTRGPLSIWQQKGPRGYSPGFAWAAKREFLLEYPFFDRGIIGGGDRALCGAALHFTDAVIERFVLNKWQKQVYLDWAQPFGKATGSIGYVSGNINHLWHGSWASRGYQSRYDQLVEYEFNPLEDITRSDEGCWAWSSEKPELHAYVKDFFSSRAEAEKKTVASGQLAVRR